MEAREQRVDHWRNSDQEQRWLATALLDLEPQLRRITHDEALPLLQQALQQHVSKGKKSAAWTEEAVTESQLRMALTQSERLGEIRRQTLGDLALPTNQIPSERL